MDGPSDKCVLYFAKKKIKTKKTEDPLEKKKGDKVEDPIYI